MKKRMSFWVILAALVMAVVGSCTTLVIKDGVTEIPNDQYKRRGLKSVTIPEGVTKIGEYAFYENKIESLIIPGSVKEIGNDAFRYNRLTSLTISEGVRVIGSSAFAGNELTNITIPESVTSIGGFAFLGNRIRRVTIMGTSLRMTSDSFSHPNNTFGFWRLDYFYTENGRRPGTYELRAGRSYEPNTCLFNGEVIGYQAGERVETVASLAAKLTEERVERERIRVRIANDPNAYMMVRWRRSVYTNELYGTEISSINGRPVSNFFYSRSTDSLEESVGIIGEWYRLPPGSHIFELKYRDQNQSFREIITTTAAGTIALSFEAGKAYMLTATPVGNKIQFSLEETTDFRGLRF